MRKLILTSMLLSFLISCKQEKEQTIATFDLSNDFQAQQSINNTCLMVRAIGADIVRIKTSIYIAEIKCENIKELKH